MISVLQCTQRPQSWAKPEPGLGVPSGSSIWVAETQVLGTHAPQQEARSKAWSSWDSNWYSHRGCGQPQQWLNLLSYSAYPWNKQFITKLKNIKKSLTNIRAFCCYEDKASKNKIHFLKIPLILSKFHKELPSYTVVTIQLKQLTCNQWKSTLPCSLLQSGSEALASLWFVH